ncbi:MAG: winged helix-turn-helix domain-containing protein [Sandaracinaceae bacterium]|nr:winged helix-turn-helix domain-containing protein [Sandaracinaceae bacterium]
MEANPTPGLDNAIQAMREWKEQIFSAMRKAISEDRREELKPMLDSFEEVERHINECERLKRSWSDYASRLSTLLKSLSESKKTTKRPRPTRAEKGRSKSRERNRSNGSSGGGVSGAASDIPSQSEFEMPILRALDKLGGTAPRKDVIQMVIEEMKAERGITAGPGDRMWRVWKERIKFARLMMVRRGWLYRDSPRGMWQITEEGRKKLFGEDQSSPSPPEEPRVEVVSSAPASEDQANP